MPLQLATPPPNSYDLIAQAISRVSTAGGAAAVLANIRDPSQISAALPHQVYALSSNDIARGRRVDGARLTSWRFLVQYRASTIAAIEFTVDAAGRNMQFGSLDTGPFAKATRDVATRAEGMDTVKQGSFELRALKAPSVYAFAVWLKNLGAGDDIVIPLQPTGPRAMRPATEGGAGPQSPKDFLQTLQPAAATQLQFDSAPGGGTPSGGGTGSKSER
jgi:hypothetical protein